jgi:(2Fe-2S) ferredoxin
MKTPEDLLPDVLEKTGVPTAKKHLFLCLGPDCCGSELGQASWDYLKTQVKNLDLQIMRTKAACFRVCSQGPILVVYPEGIWYSRATPERLERILDEHIVGGQPIQEWVIAENPLKRH